MEERCFSFLLFFFQLFPSSGSKPAVLTCMCMCVCVCVCEDCSIDDFLLLEEIFPWKKKRKTCQFAVLVELAVLVACDWQKENITVLVFNTLKLAKN